MWNQCRPDGCRFCTTWLGDWDDDAAPMLAIQDHATLQTDAAGILVVTSDIAGWVTLNLLQFLHISVCVRIPDSGCILNHRSNVHFVGWVCDALTTGSEITVQESSSAIRFLSDRIIVVIDIQFGVNGPTQVLGRFNQLSVWPWIV